MTKGSTQPAVGLESTVTFLTDEPLTSTAEAAAQFGHEGVAETLATVVRRCDPPFTVALYGSWGTGKSSVVELLRSRLSPSIPTIVIDVWKFQDDSLRRTVLKELVDQGPAAFARYNKSVTLSERVEASASVETEYKLGLLPAQVDKALEWQAPARLLPFLILEIAAIAWLLVHFGPMIPTPATQTAAAALALLAFVSSVAILLVPKKLTVSKGRFDDPYDFQKEFDDIICRGYQKASKVLIVFDNLDRVENKKAVEVLTTIKTFLEAKSRQGGKSRAVFLVPCDDAAIREQVQERFHDGDEFLRKFFNLSVRLPEFIGTELEGYARKELAKTAVPALNNSQIAWMIAKAFTSNPRQIKQFINVLVAEYLLANRRSIAMELPLGFAEENVLSLTLFMLLRTRFPEAFDAELGRRPEHVDLQENARLELQRKDMATFRDEVGHYAAISDFTPWLTLRSSKYEANLPGIDLFLVALTYADIRSAEEFIASIQDYPSAQNDLSCAVQDRAESLTQQTSFVEFFSTLLRVLSPKSLALNGTTMDQLLGRARRLVKGEPQFAAAQLDPLLISHRLKERSFGHTDFVDAWTKVLKDAAESKEIRQPRREFLVSLTKVLASHHDWFESRRTEIGQSLPTVVGRDDELLRILAEGAGAETWIETPVALAFADHMSAPGEVVGELPESMPIATPELFAARVELLATLPAAAIIDIVASRVLRAAVQVMDGWNSNSHTDDEARLSLMQSCHASLNVVRIRVAEGAVEADVLNDFTRVVKNALNSSQDTATHREAVETLVDLGDTGHHPNRNELIGVISNFISQGQIQDVRSIVSYCGGPTMPRWTECRPHVLDRSAAEPELYDGVLSDAGAEERLGWILEMLPRITAHVLHSVPAAGLSQQDTIVVCESARGLARGLAGKQLVAVLDSMAPLLGIDGMGGPLRDFTGGVGRLLMTGDESLASDGLRLLRENPNLLRDPELARELVLSVFQWLASYGDKNQPSAIDALVLHSQHLAPQERDALIAMLFDLNIRDDGRPTVVSHALFALASLGVRYDDRPANFLDIKSKATNTQDRQILDAIDEGLAAMRPNPMAGSKSARDFWRWHKDAGRQSDGAGSNPAGHTT